MIQTLDGVAAPVSMERVGRRNSADNNRSAARPLGSPPENVRRSRSRDHERRRVRRVGTARCPFDAEWVRGVVVARTRAGTKSGTCLALTFAVFRHRGGGAA
jgi:hypothetical protein